MGMNLISETSIVKSAPVALPYYYHASTAYILYQDGKWSTTN